ncbi:hypothetical protein COO60DRAFT_322873 [Scenedesmus sp. NREL 46B-D3]|nr:hypothetical protein COO60DRAFT_322873 [Scenedesmus sp. NREL 46B-D3]
MSPAAHSKGAAQQQQQQDMPPPPRMAPEQAAQHVAAAAAQQQQMQHEQQQAVAAVMDAAAGMQQGAAGLNVFRPMPQIDPTFASKFLAGGQGGAGAAAALGAAAPRFDPHAYWMSKHYGGGAASSQQSQQQQQQEQQQVSSASGQDAAAAGAAAAAVASGLMGDAMVAAAAACGGGAMRDAHMAEAGSAGGAASKQQHLSMAAASGLAGLAAAAAAASAAAVDPAAAAATPRPVVHWWQDAAATFGEIGLMDPNACGGSSKAEGMSRKRDPPQQYSLQHLPHKKRVKHAAAAAGSYGGSYYSGAHGYDQAAAGMGGWQGAPDGAFQPPPRLPSVSRERSRVRSNRMGGSSRQCESSVCSDNSASSIDNPNYIAAAAAAGRGELGPDADGVSLLLHMGQASAAQHAAVSAAAGRRGSSGGRGSGTGGRGCGTGGQGRSSSCAASAVGGTGGHSTAKSAAGILLSLSASQSDAL